MDELDDPLSERKHAAVEVMRRTGSWHSAVQALGLGLLTANELRRDDEAFASALLDARRERQLADEAAVRARLISVVVDGYPEIQTHQGRVVYRQARDEQGQVIYDPIVDSAGQPVMHVTAAGRAVPATRPRLLLDEFGQPIPETVQRFAERTTLEVAKAMGLLDRKADEDEQDGAEVVMLLDSEGQELSFSELLRRSVEARNEVMLLEEGDDAEEVQGQGREAAEG